LAALQKEHNTRNIRVLLSRLLKNHPEYRQRTIVVYQVRDTGGSRLQVCMNRDEVRQVFLSPHCAEARTVRAADPEEESNAA
ncbi:MAG: hypothetical protein H0U86_17935, partial [Chloroflexi bacterium]|nr:hypothetical protein [Chloroflexota bacterium]